MELIGRDHHFLFHHFVVLNDIQDHIGCDDRQTADFLVGEIFVGDLDDAFSSEPFRRQIVTDERRHVDVGEMQQTCHLIGFL